MEACETIQERLSAYLDGELTQQESQKIALHLRDCDRCRGVYEDFRRNRARIKSLEFPQPSEDEWRNMMGGLVFKTTRGLGWVLWAGGLAVLLAFGLYEFIRSPGVAAIERVCVLAIILGVVLVFLTVLSERVASYKQDKYKDVEK